MSDILTREEFLICIEQGEDDDVMALEKCDAALRACIQQAVLDVEKLPHAMACNLWPCDCGHDAAIANLKKGLEGKS